MGMRKLKNAELGRKSLEAFREAPKIPLVVVLDNVRSLNNVGSVFRTADAFAAEAIYLCGITGTPPNREIQKTALGATESVQWNYFEKTLEAVAKLKQENYRVIGIEQAENATMLNVFIPAEGEKLALVFGNEVNGVEQEVINVCDEVIEIPQWGTKHSMNIAVSVGVVMWDLLNKR
jgi:23S rRNA (guanosine2251-2'-O)-methyltransferase